MERPEQLARLQDDLVALATFGMTKVCSQHRDWLSAIGVITDTHEPAGSWASPSWLDVSTPAKNKSDLLRKVLIRDPLYRLHIDLMVSTVLQAVGASARWKRFEELLHGAFEIFCPRFVSLLEWQSIVTGKPPRELTIIDWKAADNSAKYDFGSWDEWAWGAAGEPATLFPLLEELYLPLIGMPVFLRMQAGIEKSMLIAALVNAARHREGVYCTKSHQQLLPELAQAGVPLRWYQRPDGNVIVALVGRVDIDDCEFTEFQAATIPGGLVDYAHQSTAASSKTAITGSMVWDLHKSSVTRAGFISIETESNSWPDTINESCPDPVRVPDSALLRDLAKTKSSSPNSDAALENLSCHLVYGFWIQVLLLEALDRELGEESLILAPPINMVVENIELQTHIYYRPRPGSLGAAASRDTLDLGKLDTVMTKLARSVGLGRVYVPFDSEEGAWSMSLRLMRTAGLIQGRSDRWAMADHVLDRLHAGGLMTRVIRKGQALRERLHEGLLDLWSEYDRQRESVGRIYG